MNDDGEGVLWVESDTAEFLLAPIETSADPTGDGAPEFQITSGTRSSPVDADWVDGAWASSGWVARTGRIDALTPLVGDGQALDVQEGEVYDLWIRFALGSELPVMRLRPVGGR